MGTKNSLPVVLDAGALLAFERNDRRVRRLIELAMEYARPLYVPSGVVAEVWRNSAQQGRLASLMSSDGLVVHSLDLDEAKAVGMLRESAGAGDIVDASVALVAQRHRAVVVTSEPQDIARFGTDVECIIC